jgi:hypothetical protein
MLSPLLLRLRRLVVAMLLVSKTAQKAAAETMPWSSTVLPAEGPGLRLRQPQVPPQ